MTSSFRSFHNLLKNTSKSDNNMNSHISKEDEVMRNSIISNMPELERIGTECNIMKNIPPVLIREAVTLLEKERDVLLEKKIKATSSLAEKLIDNKVLKSKLIQIKSECKRKVYLFR